MIDANFRGFPLFMLCAQTHDVDIVGKGHMRLSADLTTSVTRLVEMISAS